MSGIKNKEGSALIPLPNELVHPAWFWAYGVIYSSAVTAAVWLAVFSEIEFDPLANGYLILFVYIAFPLFWLDIFIRLYFFPFKRYCLEHGIDPRSDDLNRYKMLNPFRLIAFFGLGQAMFVYFSTAGREDCISARCAAAPGMALITPAAFLLLWTFELPGYRQSSGAETDE
ncbi:hypothetical protein KUV65_15770 [Maritalea mobilis]|uniref:hypothetical protein n=1 Tax=Maritalea mobilis TaxID=483324 RepID=UPI001C960FFF|nr:hypothetical protein [Maritalea mobilis]MBY6202833.1 hypothetical protein [Maritalea mobilis]